MYFFFINNCTWLIRPEDIELHLHTVSYVILPGGKLLLTYVIFPVPGGKLLLTVIMLLSAVQTWETAARVAAKNRCARATVIARTRLTEGYHRFASVACVTCGGKTHIRSDINRATWLASYIDLPNIPYHLPFGGFL